MHWRLAGSELNYRRFFDINTLAGLRVEDAATFAAVHARLARLIAEGHLQGLRIDHIDGLLDPAQYFRRLGHLIEASRPPRGDGLYIVVEKILAEHERLPRLHGVAGTTGYEWLNLISRVLLDQSGQVILDRAWREASGDARGFAQVLIEARRDVIAQVLAGEFAALLRLIGAIAAQHHASRDYAGERLRRALEAFVLHFPVYRTYLGAAEVSTGDRAVIAGAIASARNGWIGADGGIFDFLQDALTLDLAGRPGYDEAQVRRFALKMQQLTGPLMAKSLEDTALYRHHRWLALNEVGGDPAAGSLSVADFHACMEARIADGAGGLTATATHDTKRGEDARARLAALSELAEEWAQNVAEWRRLNIGLIGTCGSGRVPSAAHEYMLYQALVAAWPLEGPDGGFIDRFLAFAIKAAREGKQETSWLAPDEAYESGLKDFVLGLLDPEQSGGFQMAFGAFAGRVALLGAARSLTQVMLKSTMPGVPDFYQGTELWDLSLVDPDNRRPVDFKARTRLLQSIGQAPDWRLLAAHWPDGRIKLALIARLLAARRRFGDLFSHGRYRGVDILGADRDQIIAFARERDGAAVIVAAARSFARASAGGLRWPDGSGWNARLALRAYSGLRNLLAPDASVAGTEPAISRLFEAIPVALLQAECRSGSGGSKQTEGPSGIQ
jgi:(1->4)-alpha-D-glucan 1-alpha-D-glucosylmutase